MKVKDIRGQRFGMLSVVKFSHIGERGYAKWLCACDCGNKKIVSLSVLSAGTKSCGCLRKKGNPTHLKSKTETYKTWSAMKNRCNSKDPKISRHYKDKGIGICDRWLSYENFLADMGERPENKSIDRIDSGKGYEPGNCRWATIEEQNTNRASSHIVNHEGKPIRFSDLFRSLSQGKVEYKTALRRYVKYNWNPAVAITKEPRKCA